MHITRLTPRHAEAYRALMLRAYAEAPEAFTATVPERAPLPLEWWTARVSDAPDAPELVFGAWIEAQLVGVAGLRFSRRPRTRHKATLFGMFVRPAFRGRGIARALVEAVLAHTRATPGTWMVQLTVSASNTPAIACYTSCGFAPFGTEPYAIKMDDGYLSKIHMWCAVGPEGP